MMGSSHSLMYGCHGPPMVFHTSVMVPWSFMQFLGAKSWSFIQFINSYVVRDQINSRTNDPPESEQSDKNITIMH